MIKVSWEDPYTPGERAVREAWGEFVAREYVPAHRHEAMAKLAVSSEVISTPEDLLAIAEASRKASEE